jgi:hypothetical protein
MADLTGANLAFSDPSVQCHRRHLQLKCELLEGPFIGIARDIGSVLLSCGTAGEPAACQQVGNHGGVEGGAAFCRSPTFRVQAPRDLHIRIPFLM